MNGQKLAYVRVSSTDQNPDRNAMQSAKLSAMNPTAGSRTA